MNTKHTIVLEQGKAQKSVFEMSDEEIAEASKRIFQEVTERASKTGQLPVVRQARDKAVSL